MVRALRLSLCATLSAVALVRGQTPQENFATAVLANDAAGITSALGAGADPDTPVATTIGGNPFSAPALFIVSTNAAAVAVLASALTDENILNPLGDPEDNFTPLVSQAIQGNLGVVQALLADVNVNKNVVSRGTNVIGGVAAADVVTDNGIPLPSVSELEAVMDELASDVAIDIDFQLTDSSDTPLILAVKNRNMAINYKTAIINSLANGNADGAVAVNVSEGGQFVARTVLFYACNPDTAIGAALGAVLNVDNVDAEALDESGFACAHVIADQSDTSEEEQNAAADLLRALGTAGVNLMQKSLGNQTALHLACNVGLPIVVDALLDLGVRDNVSSANGNTALHQIADVVSISGPEECARRTAVAQDLIARGGSSLTALNGEGNTPLQEIEGSGVTNCPLLEIALGSTTATTPQPTKSGGARATASGIVAAALFAGLARSF